MTHVVNSAIGLTKLGVSTALVAGLWGAYSLSGGLPRTHGWQDDELPPPRGAVPQEQAEAPINPRRPNAIGRLRGQFPGMMQFNQQFGQPFGGQGGMSYSRTVNNGVTTTIVKEGDQETKIEETPDGIFMEMGRTYTRNDLEALRSSHPELAKAMAAFPAQADGQEVQLSVRAVTKYEAINEEDLKDEHPEAYEHYRRLSKMGQPGGGGAVGDLFGDGFRERDFPFGGFGPRFGGDVLEEAEAILEQHEQLRQEMEKRFQRRR
jgi:hypothetical protein